jgi:hypothetical protein
MNHVFSKKERGSALIALFVSITVCGAVSLGVLMTSGSRNAEAQTHLASERALQLAEAGADWGITQIRIRNGFIPTENTTMTIDNVGTFTCRYLPGRPDDASDENFNQVISTGTSARLSRTVRVVLKKEIVVPSFDAAVQLNVAVPILDLSGNSFRIEGEDHELDGSVDSSAPAKYGIASPAAVGDLTAQISSGHIDQITGLGWTATSPSVGQVPMIDLNGLVASVQAGATVLVPSGTQTHLTLGSPSVGSTVLAYCPGDLHLSAANQGAGILAVDGDLTISGGFLWTGIILVRGRVTMTGGGAAKRIIGALGVGQDIVSDVSTTSIDAVGTVDLLYSSAAVSLAAESFAIMIVASWGEVANP